MNKYIHPIQPHQMQHPLPKQSRQVSATPFKDILSTYTDVTVSKHAKARMQERNIAIHEKKWAQIAEKMKEAKAKGVTDALVHFDDVALIVNAKNNTVITALHQEEATDKIFTNINGTILL